MELDCESKTLGGGLASPEAGHAMHRIERVEFTEAGGRLLARRLCLRDQKDWRREFEKDPAWGRFLARAPLHVLFRALV